MTGILFCIGFVVAFCYLPTVLVYLGGVVENLWSRIKP